MTRGEHIAALLGSAFAPDELDVVDESHLHAGHSGSRAGGETHFRVRIVSGAFAGLNRLARHRAVNAALAAPFAEGLHALALDARAPGEAPRRAGP